MSEKKKSTHLIKQSASYGAALVLGVGGMFVAAYSGLPALFSVSYSESALVASSATTTLAEVHKEPSVVHIATPRAVKGIYLSQCVAGTPSFRDKLVSFIDDTELNTVIIDIRDYTGKIAFPTENPALADAVSDACGASDMKSFIKKLHEKDIYVIGRITTFQNPYWSLLYPDQAVQKKGGGVWKDHKGLAFVDVGAKPYWDNVVELGKVSYEIGFDELNFDYLRYPSDGPMLEADYTWSNGKPKAVVLEEFYVYLTNALRPTGAVLSADLFGMVATNQDDLNIGQVLERALPYFDYISPMVYPSHYPSGYNGYKNVNEHSYDIVKLAMDTATARAVATSTKIASFAYTPIASTTPQIYKKPSYSPSKIRPWLQSFDYPIAYTPAMVEEQIKASNDAGLDSWLFWDAANKYTSLRQVLSSSAVPQL